MSYQYNKKLVGCAQRLRREMTDEEKHLWYDFLKKLPLTVHRQKNIGPYIVDFYIATSKTVIELDGIQHAELENAERDAVRDQYLQSLGITILRYSNLAIQQRFEEVCQNIIRHLKLYEFDTVSIKPVP
ncbi:MAG: endonuclease domain-containing protein [Clostridia bacterium]|nr:endonuclease domain-containing protein [Clostridia bacterium]